MECTSPACIRTTIRGCLKLCSILKYKAFQVKIMNRVSWAQLSVLLIPPMPLSVTSQQSYVVDIRRRHRHMDRHFIGHLPFWQDRNQRISGFKVQASPKQTKTNNPTDFILYPTAISPSSMSKTVLQFGNLRELVWAGGRHVWCLAQCKSAARMNNLSERSHLVPFSSNHVIQEPPHLNQPGLQAEIWTNEKPHLRKEVGWLPRRGAALFGSLCGCLSCPMILNWIRHMTSATLVEHISSYLK